MSTKNEMLIIYHLNFFMIYIKYPQNMSEYFNRYPTKNN